jgi:tetratricopeptide (TPR) repeat protein
MKNGYTALAFIGLSFCYLSATAQGDNTSFNWKFEEGNKLMEEKLFNQAVDIWSDLLTTDPENANLSYKLGYSFFHSYNQKAKALTHLERASLARSSASNGSFNTAGYDPFDPKERNAPIEVD